VGLTGIVYYLIAYAFMTIGAFAVVIVLRQRRHHRRRIGRPRRLYQRSPPLAVLLLIFIAFARLAILLHAGFMGKYFILLGLIEISSSRAGHFAALYLVPAVITYYFPRRRSRPG